MGTKELYKKIANQRTIILDEYEVKGSDYSRSEYDFDDGYVSALDWVLKLMDKMEEFKK